MTRIEGSGEAFMRDVTPALEKLISNNMRCEREREARIEKALRAIIEAYDRCMLRDYAYAMKSYVSGPVDDARAALG
jgi:hypothetical protein